MKARILTALGLLATITVACSEAPTLNAPTDSPQFDGGFGMGSGGKAAGDTVTVDGAETVVTDSAGTPGLGGFGMGSGG